MRKLLLLLVICACVGRASAQNIDVVFDVVQFRTPSKMVRWEFHYAIPDTAMTYVRSGTSYAGALEFEIVLSNPVVDGVRHKWTASASAANARPPHTSFLTDMQLFELQPAQYNVALTVRDVNDSAKVFSSNFVSVVRPPSDEVSLSELLVVYAGVEPSQVRNPNHLRYGTAAVPNPRRECIGDAPSLGVFVELYNTSKVPSKTFVLDYEILDNVGRILDSKQALYSRNEQWLADRTDIDVSELPSGVYFVRTSIRSSPTAPALVSRTDRFFVLNPSKPPVQQAMISEEEQFDASEWATHVGDRLELELELSDILATNSEKIIRKGLTEDRAKQKYLFRFWASRDPDPATKVNERLEEFRWAFERAQSAYARPGQSNGWKTDRGRVLLKYGKPNQVILSNATIDTKPYEDWFYTNMQGGVHFYFVDRFNNNSHQLVHSTLMGEISDPKWMERWARTGMPDVNPTRTGDMLNR
jgi:GWxTD domain-containing protein